MTDQIDTRTDWFVEVDCELYNPVGLITTFFSKYLDGSLNSIFLTDSSLSQLSSGFGRFDSTITTNDFLSRVKFKIKYSYSTGTIKFYINDSIRQTFSGYVIADDIYDLFGIVTNDGLNFSNGFIGNFYEMKIGLNGVVSQVYSPNNNFILEEISGTKVYTEGSGTTFTKTN